MTFSPADSAANSVSALSALARELQSRQAELGQEVALLRRQQATGEDRLKSVLEGTNAGLWEWNVQTGEAEFNERWAEIVGHTLADLAPVSIQTWLALAHPMDLEGSERELNRVFTREVVQYDYECRMKHRDGTWVWVHDRGKVIEWTEDGKPLRMVGTHTDITDRKRAEEAVRESAALYHAMFERNSAVKLLIDPADGSIVDANSAACEFYGYPSEKLKSMRISEINTMPAADIETEMARALNGNRTYFQFRHRLASGDIRDVEVYSSLIAFAGRQLLNSIVHDISERRRAEGLRLELERRLLQAQKAESLSRMAGAVAHRFSNQLQAVTGNLELARHSMAATDEASCRVHDALKASFDAAALCGLMLAYLGHEPGQHVALDLACLLRCQLPSLRDQLPGNVRLDFEEPASAAVVRGDSEQVQRMLSQLVSNAAEALNGTSGTVRLMVRTLSAGAIPVRNRFPPDWQPSDQEYACLEVTDHGCGIAKADIDKLFDPFYSTKFTGRGMGLPVVLGLVRAHGGGVGLESAPGKGSAFRVYLPILS